MGQFNVCQRSWRRLPAVQGVIEPGDEQAIFNGIKALGTLRMTLSHFV
jgi:hypothetical protein